MKKNKINKIWEIQEYDSEISFKRFERYFLWQKKRPRTLNMAYRNFLIDGGKTLEDAKKCSPSSSWQRWWKAKDSRGNVIEGANTWSERAEALDVYLKNSRNLEDKEKRNNLLNTELDDVALQLDVWKTLFESHRDLVTELKSKGEIKNISKLVSSSMELFKLRDGLAVFYRRSLKMPATIKEDLYDNSNDETIEFKFEEPFNEDDEIGIGGEEINGNQE